jgi:hypothetical protein
MMTNLGQHITITSPWADIYCGVTGVPLAPSGLPLGVFDCLWAIIWIPFGSFGCLGHHLDRIRILLGLPSSRLWRSWGPLGARASLRTAFCAQMLLKHQARGQHLASRNLLVGPFECLWAAIG